MADLTAKWDFNTLNDAKQTAYIAEAKKRGFEIDATNGNITAIPEMADIPVVNTTVISFNAKKAIEDGKPTSVVFVKLSDSVKYFDKETLAYKDTDLIRLNDSLSNKLSELGFGGIILSKVVTLEELKQLALPKLSGTTVAITVSMSTNDKYGYGSAPMPKFKADFEVVRGITEEITTMLTLKKLNADINGNAKPIT